MKGDFNETDNELKEELKRDRDHYKDVAYSKSLIIKDLDELLNILKTIPDMPKLATYLIITKQKELLRNG